MPWNISNVVTGKETRDEGATHHIAAPTRLDMDRKSPMMGMLSKKEAANPKAIAVRWFYI